MDTSFVEVYRPGDQQELMVLKPLLDARGIRYYVTNENFNSILPVAGVGEMRLMVEQERVQECLDLLRDALGIEPLSGLRFP
ncbi:MAG: DUF2007 domain-containing protein [Betaproteobacteria bacterium]|nr:DUF2007 domain-containing protein [Betaproteobacteria bacterium]